MLYVPYPPQPLRRPFHQRGASERSWKGRDETLVLLLTSFLESKAILRGREGSGGCYQALQYDQLYALAADETPSSSLPRIVKSSVAVHSRCRRTDRSKHSSQSIESNLNPCPSRSFHGMLLRCICYWPRYSPTFTMMKFAVLVSLLASAAAFAPMSKVCLFTVSDVREEL